MYGKPLLQEFGRFRDLTQFGLGGVTDGFTITGVNGGSTSSPGCGINIGIPGYECPTATTS